MSELVSADGPPFLERIGLSVPSSAWLPATNPPTELFDVSDWEGMIVAATGYDIGPPAGSRVEVQVQYYDAGETPRLITAAPILRVAMNGFVQSVYYRHAGPRLRFRLARSAGTPVIDLRAWHTNRPHLHGATPQGNRQDGATIGLPSTLPPHVLAAGGVGGTSVILINGHSGYCGPIDYYGHADPGGAVRFIIDVDGQLAFMARGTSGVFGRTYLPDAYVQNVRVEISPSGNCFGGVMVAPHE